jgi:predicted short-subunit dehydrogenase-like oxidoreductase (DUF2520 family)
MQRATPRIGFIGAGRAGSALATALHDAGYSVVAIASRTPASASALASRIPGARATSLQGVIDASDLIFITTPDAAIGDVAAQGRWRPGTAVVHTSGVENRYILQAAADHGAAIGSLHPLQTFAGRDRSAKRFDGTVFAVEAEGELRELLLEIVKALRGRAIEINEAQKALYHASATFASNYVVTLMSLAADIWQRFGWERDDAVAALLPLMQGALSNVEMLGVTGALTGPVARGDVATVEKHIEALRSHDAAVLETYRALARHTLPLARDQGGLSEDAAREIERLLEGIGAAPAR